MPHTRDFRFVRPLLLHRAQPPGEMGAVPVLLPRLREGAEASTPGQIMKGKRTMEFFLRFHAQDVKDIPRALREIADEVPEDIGPVGIRLSPEVLLLLGDGKQK